jgi:outer membrane protein insertion porin family
MRKKPTDFLLQFVALTLLFATLIFTPHTAEAQNYRFTNVAVEGNQRIQPDTIVTYAGIARGQTVSAGDLNDAYQRIVDSGLFETVEIVPRGGTLLIKVVEYPTINRVAFEGNRKIKDEDLTGIVESKPRQVFSPTRAERDANLISEAYTQTGRVSARVSPKIIRRADNRVDLVFEIFEGRGIEIQRVSFVGNTVYSDRRLRRVIDSKQAGLLRAFISSDTFVEDRLAFDRQVLTDFYQSRGYVDIRITGTNAELTRERDAYFVTFNIQEGQQFRFGEITATSEISEANADDYLDILKIKPGVVYSPTKVENAIARMERLAIRDGVDFLRVEPRITRNDRDLTLDVEFALVRGPRIFVERIDIEGNTTTLDRVIRRQFDTVEGDPFNPREIRETAERIRALGYFADAEVNAREGSRPDQVIVDVDVEETTTGTLSFGASYSSDAGFGITAGFSERNFLGRGQILSARASIGGETANYTIDFFEPAFLGRDVGFSLQSGYSETDDFNSLYNTSQFVFRPGLRFNVNEFTTASVFVAASMNEMKNYQPAPASPQFSPTLAAEVARGSESAVSFGLSLAYDTRERGLDLTSGVLVEGAIEVAGLGGDQEFTRSSLKLVGEKLVLNEDVKLRASLEGGMLDFRGGQTSRAVDRYTQRVIRGFESNGIGPSQAGQKLGGNAFAAAKFEAEFPLGLPAEFGVTGGLFYDIGSIWDVNTVGAPAVVSEGFKARQVVGASVFWESPFGPLRIDFTKALEKEPTDVERTFDLSIRTDF